MSLIVIIDACAWMDTEAANKRKPTSKFVEEIDIKTLAKPQSLITQTSTQHMPKILPACLYLGLLPLPPLLVLHIHVP